MTFATYMIVYFISLFVSKKATTKDVILNEYISEIHALTPFFLFAIV